MNNPGTQFIFLIDCILYGIYLRLKIKSTEHTSLLLGFSHRDIKSAARCIFTLIASEHYFMIIFLFSYTVRQFLVYVGPSKLATTVRFKLVDE